MTAGSDASGSAPAVHGALARIEQWGATRCAAGASDPTGTLAVHGDPHERFAVASLTKLLTAWTCLIAVEEETIALDEPAGPPGSTVHHLLAHTSGLDFDSESVLDTPGSRRIYSNTGYEHLARHLAERSGITFEDYLTEGVLQPLGMTSTGLEGSAASGALSCVQDLLAFLAEMRDPKLLSQQTSAALRTVQFPGLGGVLPGWGSFEANDWGLGPEIRGTKSPHWSGLDAPAGTIGHFGGSGCLLWLDPDTGLGCVALGDRPFDEWSVSLWPGFSDGVRAALGSAA